MKKFRQSPGDWKCPDEDCGNINFSKRLECNRCGKDKPYVQEKKKDGKVGQKFAIRSNGLFSAEDWQCKGCGNINWAKRNTCNVCNKNRFEKPENRTGIGGGYCERDDNVEYNNHDDTMDTYDEFGLIKKKYRKKDDAPVVVNDMKRNEDIPSESEHSSNMGDYDFDDMSESDTETEKIKETDESVVVETKKIQSATQDFPKTSESTEKDFQECRLNDTHTRSRSRSPLMQRETLNMDSEKQKC
ncbi:hypothetical protein A3Q56_01265 [Intoshia linei]|uniref:Zinc finger Ran-binding domain-containing protein 2 n=1 Tax=Intoshia linei TaxID=1819745 RepID=A0A177BBH0_9BILA|nr:hypothetical protein A3Q56_01265 [Intoshia linei]